MGIRNLLKWYFSPLAEYTLRLRFSEQELRTLLERECVSTHFKIWSWHDIKAQWRVFKAQWCMTGFPVFLIKKKRENVLLHPVGKGSNYTRYNIHLLIQPVPDSAETELHVVIKSFEKPLSLASFYFFLFLFWVLAGGLTKQLLPIAFGLVMILYSFFLLKIFRYKLEKDVPLIREALKRLLKDGMVQ